MILTCGICGCNIFPQEEEVFESQYGHVDVLCYRSLEILGRVWN
jgi:hypothetical protein